MSSRSVLDLCLLSVRDAGKGFLISLRSSGRYSDSYLDALENGVALLAAFADENEWPPVSDITTAHIEEYLYYLARRPRWFGIRKSQRPVSKTYVNTQYRRLTRFFNWLVSRAMIVVSPLALIEHPQFEQRVIQTVAEGQVADILELTDPSHARTAQERFRAIRNRAMVIILWDTPGRRSEFANLSVGDVNLDAGVMVVMGKGSRERSMPFGQTASAALWEYLEARRHLDPDNDAFWVSAQGIPMTPDGFYRTIKVLGERAGVQDLHTHRFRHSFTMNALRSKMPQHVLMMIAGWRKKVPDTYLQTLGEEDAVRFHREMSPADRLGLKKARPKTAARGKASKGKL